MKGRKLSFTTRYVLAFGILLLVATTALGIVVLNQSMSAMEALINKNMLDVVKSAAESLDGDALGALTEDDVDGPVFRDVEERLLLLHDGEIVIRDHAEGPEPREDRGLEQREENEESRRGQNAQKDLGIDAGDAEPPAGSFAAVQVDLPFGDPGVGIEQIGVGFFSGSEKHEGTPLE